MKEEVFLIRDDHDNLQFLPPIFLSLYFSVEDMRVLIHP